MKLIVVGANGFVAKEIIRQSLRTSAVGEVVAVSRSEVTTPEKLYPNSNVSKLRVVKVDDYDIYTDVTKEAFAGADGCIWYVPFLLSCTLGSTTYTIEYLRHIDSPGL